MVEGGEMRWAMPAALGVGVVSLAALLIATGPADQPVVTASTAPAAVAADTAAAPPEEAASVVAAPEAATISGPTLVFASFNVCKVDCAPPAPSWDVRRDRVARVITESGLDVIGLQEVTHNATATAKTQFLDVQQMVAPAGYVSPVYTKESDECRWTQVGVKACTHTTGILFNANTVRQVELPNGMPSAGTVPSSRIDQTLTGESATRKVTWAYLEGLNGTGPFLALSVHTDSAKDPETEANRVRIATSLTPWSQAWNEIHGMPGVPVVLMADLNSYLKRQPNGAQKVLTDAGWLDSAAAARQVRNTQFSTINYNPQLGLEQGFPRKPYEFRATKKNPVVSATRIDYVMALGPGMEALDYEVVIRLSPDGSFDPNYQASDHQMVRTTMAFPLR